jgi:monoamine oxidase
VVSIVGLGFAGIVPAVEGYRKGHHVILFEQSSAMTSAGNHALEYY